MYCPVETTSPLFTLEMNGIQCKNGVFVSPTMLFSVKPLNIFKECFS